MVSTDTYDAFGQRLSGGAYVDAYGYGGQAGYRTDAETGLSLLTHRYYDPAAGRFVTRDPLGYDGGINLYSYTQNDPANWMDPDGTDTTDTIIMETSTGIGILTGGIIGGGGGGIAGAGVGAIPGAYAGAAVGGAAGVVVGGLAVGLRHALMNMSSGGGGGVEAGPGEEDDDTPIYKGSKKHGPTKVGNSSAAPRNGQAALDNSVQIKNTSPRRIGTDPANDEIVVLDRTLGREYHGHTRAWDELTREMKDALTGSGKCNARGKILK